MLARLPLAHGQVQPAGGTPDRGREPVARAGHAAAGPPAGAAGPRRPAAAGRGDAGPGIALLGRVDERGAEIERAAEPARVGVGAAAEARPGFENETIAAVPAQFGRGREPRRPGPDDGDLDIDPIHAYSPLWPPWLRPRLPPGT